MSNTMLDPRLILSSPLFYRLFSTLVGQGPARDIYVNDYIRPKPGNRILDIGCGPGDIVEHLPDNIEYIGFDMSAIYIDAARKRFADQGTFICAELDEAVLKEQPPFDIVIAIGVIHHLSDEQAEQLFRIAQTALRPGGRVITVDPVFHDQQSRLEHYLVSRDRGEFVRNSDVYPLLIPDGFKGVKTSIRKRLLRMPYSLMFMECFL